MILSTKRHHWTTVCLDLNEATKSLWPVSGAIKTKQENSVESLVQDFFLNPLFRKIAILS